jgi:hypothetical protein
MKNVTVEMKRVVKSRPLNSQYLDPTYPSNSTPFYLYGNCPVLRHVGRP